MDFGLSGKTVLVVGGTSGIDIGIAQAFVSQGALVVATGATAQAVEVASGKHDAIAFHVLDVRDANAVEGFVSALRSLDVFVNCAGRRRATSLPPPAPAFP